MAEPLKNSFGPDIPVRIARMIEAVYPKFASAHFIADAQDGYDALELTPRARQIARSLATHLPDDFEQAAPILMASLGPPIESDELVGQGMAPFLYLPHVIYVAEHGAGHWETAMAVQYELTKRFSCEYSIRFFLEAEPKRTLARLREWTRDANPHVRRLVSEGTRPRLPWAPRLRRFQEDPGPIVELLELLKDDPTTLVRRSVANNLNDIGKDHPILLVDVARSWMVGASPERQSLIRHALRSAVKRGEPGALEVLGFQSEPQMRVDGISIRPAAARIGDTVTLGFSVTNLAQAVGVFNVDLKINFVKANGSTRAKVFKVGEVNLGPGESKALSKSISLAQHTTRTHYPGVHPVEIVINGSSQPLGHFQIGTP